MNFEYSTFPENYKSPDINFGTQLEVYKRKIEENKNKIENIGQFFWKIYETSIRN